MSITEEWFAEFSREAGKAISEPGFSRALVERGDEFLLVHVHYLGRRSTLALQIERLGGESVDSAVADCVTAWEREKERSLKNFKDLTPLQVADLLNRRGHQTNAALLAAAWNGSQLDDGDFLDEFTLELVKLRLARKERAISQDGYELWEQVTKAVCDAFRPPASKFSPVVAPPEAPEPQPEPPEYA